MVSFGARLDVLYQHPEWVVDFVDVVLPRTEMEDVCTPVVFIRRLHAMSDAIGKRIYDPRGDCGDSIIVFNSRHIAAKDNSLYWRRFLYTHHTRFGPYRVEETMEEMHARDPTEVLRREVRSHLKNCTGRSDWLARLHIFADGIETLPKELIENVSGVIRQVLPVPRRLEAYSAEEIKAYPKLFEWPENYAVRPISVYTKPRPRAGKVPTITKTKT